MGVTVINTTFNNIPNVALGCIGVWSIRRKSLTNYITPQTGLARSLNVSGDGHQLFLWMYITLT
jgi:hypothetical protein